MTEQGVVTQIKGKFAIVSVDKKEECAGCGLCLFKDNATKTEIYAFNVQNAREGDVVIVERSEHGKPLGSILVFLVPLLFIGIAVALNYLFLKNEIWVLALSAAFMVIWYVVLGLVDGKIKKSGAFSSEIVGIVSRAETVADAKNEGNNTQE
ncbi:MAG: SoxR reducing system RseC family protein [Clostridia bacterium]|nr:SoxR reducing system RseC family protein [Clostridia bacterium]